MDNINETELQEVVGGIDKQNPWALEIWYYNSETKQKKYYRGSYPSQESAKAAKNEVNARHAQYGFQPQLTKIYKAI